MESRIINHPYLTAIQRNDLSVPTRYLLTHNLLKGRILDFGCGYGFDADELSRLGFDIVGYDYYYRPDFPEGKFDTILCNYVLNVLEPYAQAEILMNVTNLLSPHGCAYFAVRRDLKDEGFRLHAIHRQYTYQCNVYLPYKSLIANSSYELYQYRHFNRQPRNKGERCPFCNLSRRIEIICETATCVAFYDGYPAAPGHALIIPKRHVSSYFDLTNHELEAMNLVLQFVKQKIDDRFHPDGYNIGVNVGEAAGQSVFHSHMHVIPRYKGDVPNPKGGVRGVIPTKQGYPMPEKPHTTSITAKKLTLEEKRAKHRNAYEKWTDEADESLRHLYHDGMSIEWLAKFFGRSNGAIESRLEKLGELIPET